MKHLLITTIAAVVLAGCGPSKPPDISIHDAAREGNIEAIKQAIADGAEVNAKGIGGFTPLLIAAMEGHNEVVELLISKGADVDARQYGNGLTPLRFAAERGYKEIVELLISKGADVNAKEGNLTALNWADGEIADLLRKHGGKTGAELSIHKAAEAGNIEAVKQHLAAGANVNAKDEDGATPLHLAYENGNGEVVKYLVEKGANLNAKTKGGQTLLHIAAYEGRNKTIELLVKKGAEVNPLITLTGSFNGMTPVDFAIRQNKLKTVDLLRKHGGKTGDELKAAGN